MPRTRKSEKDRVELQEKVDKKQILDLYLGGHSSSEIATKLGCTRENVEYHLGNIESNVNFAMIELSEKLVALNIARVENVIKAVYPLALQADFRAIKALIDLLKLEVDWRDKILPKENPNSTVTINIERFEQTFSTSNELYTSALDDLQQTWLGGDEPQVHELYGLPSDTLPAPSENIIRLEALANKIVGELDGETPDTE